MDLQLNDKTVLVTGAEEIRTGLSGNICRCTGYVGIVDAVRQAAVTMKD